MTVFVALLRAVNVGGTGKLAMGTLVDLCRDAGLADVRTYIASGNAIFRADDGEAGIRAALEARLEAYAGKKVGVVVRRGQEIAETLARNPFADQPGNRVMALFTDGPLPADPLEGVTGQQGERIATGLREMFIYYPDGMASTRLRLPADRTGTARNMNTVAKLADICAAMA
jgi:uncharacterized protein (DUF1697 family)